MNPIDILEWKWVKIAMKFVVGFSKLTRGHDAISDSGSIDKVRSLSIDQNEFTMNQFEHLYVRDIVRLYGVSVSIVSK